MTLALYIAVPVASFLAYVAIAGRFYRWSQDTLDASGDDYLMGLSWPIVAVVLCLRWPVQAVWRLGADKPKPKLPKAEVRK